MWIYLALASAFFLGFYDIFKKKSLKKNDVLWVLVAVTGISVAILSPFFRTGPATHHLLLVPKGLMVALSWISGLIAMKLLPLTTVSTIKASRPVFVLLAGIFVFGERLNLWQWIGVTLAFTALWMLSRSSRKEGISWKGNKGILWMAVSVFSGVGSAIYDKYLMSIEKMDSMFVLCWSNLYILVILSATLAVGTAVIRRRSIRTASTGTDAASGTSIFSRRFHWDWNLAVAAIIIVVADALYFQSLARDGAMLAIISMIRRCSVIVTFIGSAIIFKENNIRDKAIDLAVLMSGITIMAFLS